MFNAYTDQPPPKRLHAVYELAVNAWQGRRRFKQRMELSYTMQWSAIRQHLQEIYCNMCNQSSESVQLLCYPRIAGALLLLTAITHFSQLWVMDVAPTVLASAAFALPYAALSGSLMTKPRALAAYLAIIATAIGAVAGIIRYFVVQPNLFSVAHPLIDAVIIALLLKWLLTRSLPSK